MPENNGLRTLSESDGTAVYEPGKCSGACIKDRLNLGQEFVIGGFTSGPHRLDSIIVGYYSGDDLVYVARTRNGFVPASRRRVFENLRPLVTPECPFVNLPETHKARWGEALTAEKMKNCVWVRPDLVAQALGGSAEREVTGVKKRVLSAAGRAAIAKAAKKRWAKVRKQTKREAA